MTTRMTAEAKTTTTIITRRRRRRRRRGSRTFATPLAVTTFAGIIASAGAQMEERWLRDQSPPQCIFGDWLFCLADADADATTATQLANGLFMYMVYVLICLIYVLLFSHSITLASPSSKYLGRPPMSVR